MSSQGRSRFPAWPPNIAPDLQLYLESVRKQIEGLGSGGTATIKTQLGGAAVSNASGILNFNGTDFTASESPAGTTNVNVASGIARLGTVQTWTATQNFAAITATTGGFSGQVSISSTADPALLFTGGAADSSTFVYGSISSVGKFRIQRDGKISALSLNVQSGTDINAGSSVFSVSNTGLTTALQLTLTAAVSKIIPGVTSLSLRNTADSADNLLITNAGNATLLGTFSASGGQFTVDVNGHATISGASGELDLVPRSGGGSNWIQYVPVTASYRLYHAGDQYIFSDTEFTPSVSGGKTLGLTGTRWGKIWGNDADLGNVAMNALTATTGNFSSDLTLQARLLFTTAASKIVPGATSLSHRNNADSADNLLLSDAGIATLRNDLIINTLGTFDSTGTRFGSVGSVTAYDVLSYDGTAAKWRPRLLQTSFNAAVVAASALSDGTFLAAANSNPTLPADPGTNPGTPNTPTLIPIYQGMIVDVSNTTLPANELYVIDYSVNGGAYTSNAIIGTGTRFVHSGLDSTKTYAYKVRIHYSVSNFTAYSTATAATNPSSVTETNAYGIVVASQIATIYLSAITANMGLITAGQIRNTSKTGVIQLDTTFALDTAAINGLFFAGANPIPGQITGLGIDFTATGTNPILKASKLLLNADGTAKFFGNIDITQSYTDVAAWWISLRDTSVAHGMTALAPTNMFAAFAFHNTSQGGLTIDSWTSGGAAMELIATATTTVTGTTAGTFAITVAKKSGTSSVALAATDNAIWFANAATTIALFKGNGDTTLGGILRVADGAVGAPSISFTNATTTGLFRIAAVGGCTLATSGVGLLSVTTSGGKNYLQRERAGGAVAVQHLGGVLSAVGDSVVSTSGTGETDLKSYTVLANTLDETYRAIRFEAWGSASGNASTQTIRVYYGGTLQISFDNGANASFRGWYVRGIIHYTGASAQEMWIEGGFAFPGPNGGTPRTVVDRALPAKSNTADEILKITGQAVAGSLSQYAFDVWYTP